MHFDLVSGLERVLGLALLAEFGGTAGFERPALALTLFIFHVGVDHDMGLTPVDLDDRRRRRQRRFGIELGIKWMMRECNHRTESALTR